MIRSTIILITLLLVSTAASTAQGMGANVLNLNSIGVEKGGVRATREFWKMYGEVKGERWYKFPGGYLAEYREENIDYKCIFDRSGRWMYTMKQYGEKELATEVRGIVKRVYYDYSIGWVKEVLQRGPDAQAYVIHIDDPKSWKDLLVRDGEMEILREASKP